MHRAVEEAIAEAQAYVDALPGDMERHNGSGTCQDCHALRTLYAAANVLSVGAYRAERQLRELPTPPPAWPPSAAALAELQDVLGEGGVVMGLGDPAKLHNTIAAALGEPEVAS